MTIQSGQLWQHREHRTQWLRILHHLDGPWWEVLMLMGEDPLEPYVEHRAEMHTGHIFGSYERPELS